MIGTDEATDGYRTKNTLQRLVLEYPRNTPRPITQTDDPARTLNRLSAASDRPTTARTPAVNSLCDITQRIMPLRVFTPTVNRLPLVLENKGLTRFFKNKL